MDSDNSCIGRFISLLTHLHGFAAPCENAHASNQFLGLEWFYKVIICTQLKSLQFLAKFVLRCNNNNREMTKLWVATYAREDLKPIHFGQLEINQENFRLKGWKFRQSLAAGACIIKLVLSLFE